MKRHLPPPDEYEWHDFTKNKVLEGIFVGQIKKFGAFRKTVFIFLNDNHRKYIWGSSILNHELYGVPFQTRMKITYLGKFKGESSNYPMHHYKVEPLVEIKGDGLHPSFDE